MLNSEIQKSFNEQINHETGSAYLYWSMAAWFAAEGWPGFASWLRVQALEEMTHAEKFYTHIMDRGGRVEMLALAKPKGKWTSAVKAFEDVLKHEQFITGKIHALVDLASAQKDHPGFNFLQWFVNEQVEEEKSAEDVLNMLKKVEGGQNGMFMLDQQMAARRFTPPAAQATA